MALASATAAAAAAFVRRPPQLALRVAALSGNKGQPLLDQKRRARDLPAWADTGRFARLDFWEQYHEERNRERQHHEWFVDVEGSLQALLPSLQAACERSVRPAVLHLGCGTSALGVQLARHTAGARVTNLDFSPAAIDSMREAYPDDDWVVGDALNMPFSDGTFDLVVDKGTFDAFECAAAAVGDKGDGPALQLFQEVSRVLSERAGSAWVQITHSGPELRLEVLRKCLAVDPAREWSIACRSLGEDDTGFEYFLYILERRQPTSRSASQQVSKL
eukprot:TRINITY_DN1971_c0_g4_i2.p1 TRINITY_DN1971_c0_g4~~TRINITY_DN1971_c0_g4_i2.p1  ORF type:complete len:276 (-),score=47.70 TRINITY_DN1971_c0_g4_i2:157-984(-)